MALVALQALDLTTHALGYLAGLDAEANPVVRSLEQGGLEPFVIVKTGSVFLVVGLLQLAGRYYARIVRPVATLIVGLTALGVASNLGAVLGA